MFLYFSQTKLNRVLRGTGLKSVEVCRHQIWWGTSDNCDIDPIAAELAVNYPTLQFISLRITSKHYQGRNSVYDVVHDDAGIPLRMVVQDRVSDPHRPLGSESEHTYDLRKVGVVSKLMRVLKTG